MENFTKTESLRCVRLTADLTDILSECKRISRVVLFKCQLFLFCFSKRRLRTTVMVEIGSSFLLFVKHTCNSAHCPQSMHRVSMAQTNRTEHLANHLHGMRDGGAVGSRSAGCSAISRMTARQSRAGQLVHRVAIPVFPDSSGEPNTA